MISLMITAIFLRVFYLLPIGRAHGEQVKSLGILDLIRGTVDIQRVRHLVGSRIGVWANAG